MNMKIHQIVQKEIYSIEDTNLFSSCTLCPRECRVNRFDGSEGFCKTDAGLSISSICVHRGEEPVISGPSGICNIFFSGCNLRCIYCQNHEISRCGSGSGNDPETLENVLDRIAAILSEGIKAVGFVSPSHVVPQVRAIITGLRSRGIYPITVYNTNGYDKAGTLQSLSGLIDVYLPDFKYISPEIASEYSDAADYPSIALKAIKEMYYQKGSILITDMDGIASNGILLRHLVLPGHADESKKVLRTIADEISTGISISLMSQYHPTKDVSTHSVLRRTLYRYEYDSVVQEMERLGFRNGWVQDMDSYANYRPDFSKKHPFE
jgi:putative pyruvate formate lyase activating enzyme